MDCGEFAIANASTLANDRNPQHTSYDRAVLLRPHLEKNFEEGRITPFPTSKIAVTKCRLKHCFIKTYCICNRPECYDSKMLECEDCCKWFHYKCVGLKLSCDVDVWKCSGYK